MKLSSTQKALLDDLREVDLNYKAVKASALRDAQRAAQARIQGIADTRALAIHKAVAAGIPKRQVHMEGLGTLSPNELYSILANTPEIVAVAEEVVTDRGPFSWADEDRTEVAISYPYATDERFGEWVKWDLTTTPPKQMPYRPDVMTGTVKREAGETGKTAWSIVEDGNMTETTPFRKENGFPDEPGPLTWYTQGGFFRDELDAWFEANTPK